MTTAFHDSIRIYPSDYGEERWHVKECGTFDGLSPQVGRQPGIHGRDLELYHYHHQPPSSYDREDRKVGQR
jgi:hypothetical protein